MKTLTLAQKQQLFAEFQCRQQNDENVTQAALARWERESFCLEYVPNRSTMRYIIRTGPTLSSDETTTAITAKRNRQAVAPRLKMPSTNGCAR